MIYEYLDRTFTMSLADYFAGRAFDTYLNKGVLVTDISDHVEKVFGLSMVESRKIGNKWWDSKEIPFIEQEMDGALNGKQFWI